ncbi:hypothetical protein [Streptomyces sp. NPDC094049]|uniref:hypothetical protein n=1 Tax=Streptomyces sp. NPDC094049 TaxID=3154987 RepID=UPI0033280128
MTGPQSLKPFLLAFPGPLRNRLVAAVPSGEEAATTGLLGEMREALGDPAFTVDDGTMPVGKRFRVMAPPGSADGVAGARSPEPSGAWGRA